MTKKIDTNETLNGIIQSVKKGEAVKIQAIRLASFKASVSRLNQSLNDIDKYGFKYSKVVIDGFIKATRIEYVSRIKIS